MHTEKEEEIHQCINGDCTWLDGYSFPPHSDNQDELNGFISACLQPDEWGSHLSMACIPPDICPQTGSQRPLAPAFSMEHGLSQTPLSPPRKWTGNSGVKPQAMSNPTGPAQSLNLCISAQLSGGGLTQSRDHKLEANHSPHCLVTQWSGMHGVMLVLHLTLVLIELSDNFQLKDPGKI